MPQNDYGVYQEGTDLWLKTEVPTEWSSVDQAIDNLSYAEGAAIATYITNTESVQARVGRPKKVIHH